MAGIARIVIVPTPNHQRFRDAKERWSTCYATYRQIFADLGIPLAEGTEELECSEEEALGRLDRKLGIDVILSWDNGMRATLQEKILFTSFGTVTVEYMNDPNAGEWGDWHHLMGNYYFVAYSKKPSLEFWSWILLDWAAVQRETLRGNISWQLKPNRPPARANFKYVPFDELPSSCIIARSGARTF